LAKDVSELKLLFDTYFKPVQQPTLTRHRSVGRPLVEERGSLRGTEDFRNQQLQEVLDTLKKAIKKRERRKRKLIREAMRLQKEADVQVGLIHEIQRLEETIKAKDK